MTNYDKKLEILKKILNHLGPQWSHYERMSSEISQGINEGKLNHYVEILTKTINQIHDEKKKAKMLKGISMLHVLHQKEQERMIQERKELEDILHQIDEF